MIEYPKIQSVFKRQDTKPYKFLENEFSLPEFEYLKHLKWRFTEKIDGTNIRIGVQPDKLLFSGRTDNSQIPSMLLTKLQELFPFEKVKEILPVNTILFGEGYGPKIQNGHTYCDELNFRLFDVWIGGWWLEWHNVKDVSEKLSILTVPEIGVGSLLQAIDKTKRGFKSSIGERSAEGMVVRPIIDLYSRKGDRIITKIKTKDFV